MAKLATPATRQRMFRQLLVALLDTPAPTIINFDERPDRTPYLTLHALSAQDAERIATALRLRNRGERGQPYPLAGLTEFWTGTLYGDLMGWRVNVEFHVPFAGEYVDRWAAEGGFKRHGTARPWPETAEQVAA